MGGRSKSETQKRHLKGRKSEVKTKFE